ncbi:MAG TPA: isoprenylcysteine carboxyl methyltransferase [Ruminococcus sp.]|nr:isoprenylcysteine carboxyl methyltransferase [Ruminococcus sp.]
MIFQIIAIVILTVFYGCYFTKMISQRKKGIQTDQIGKGKVGFVKFIEVTMKIITIIVPIAEIISIFVNFSVLPVWARIAGICIAVTGVSVFITSVVTMRDSWRAGVSKTDKTELVTSGIYSFSRNPAFLGFDLVYLGILLMFFNLPLYIISLLAIIILHLQIVNVEEDFLIDTFGEEYLNYKRKVCRYFGRR